MTTEQLSKVMRGMYGEDIAAKAELAKRTGLERIFLAASPIVKAPATVTFRVVLYLEINGMGAGFVVHNQQWVDALPEEIVSPEHTGSLRLGIGSMSEGSYFNVDQLEEAMTCFVHRCERVISNVASACRQVG